MTDGRYVPLGPIVCGAIVTLATAYLLAVAAYALAIIGLAVLVALTLGTSTIVATNRRLLAVDKRLELER